MLFTMLSGTASPQTGLRPSRFLRQAMVADALISGATGLLMFFGVGLLANLLDLPQTLLRYSGLILLPFALYVAYLATRSALRRSDVWGVIVANGIWAAASIGLLVSGWVAPNVLGVGFVIFQAGVVAVFAEMQFVGLRRSAASTG